MKKHRFKPTAGLNFKRIVSTLSNNALAHLVTIATQEASHRNLKLTLPNLGEHLPVIYLRQQVVTIRNEEWKLASYKLGTSNWVTIPSYDTIEIDPEQHDWFALYKQRSPISIKLVSLRSAAEKIIEFHSRSKIFWFNKLLTASNTPRVEQYIDQSEESKWE